MMISPHMAQPHGPYKNDRERVEACVDKRPDGCWLWRLGTFGGGYGCVRVKGRTLLAHRWVWEVLVGPVPDGSMLCHHCGVRICCNPRHMYVGDIRSNSQDTILHGSLRGSRHPSALLNEEAVRLIRTEYAKGGVRQVDLAVRFGVSRGTIAAIVIGRVWKHVDGARARGAPRYVGEETPHAKLCEDDVRTIRRDYTAGTSQRELATRFGVAVSTISSVLRRENWAHVE